MCASPNTPDGRSGPPADPGAERTDANPNGGLVIAGNVLYGTTRRGGSTGNGTVFSLSDSPPMPAPPRLTISRVEVNVIVAWPTCTNGLNYTLQSTTNLAAPIWTSNLPTPLVENGQNSVTTPISGLQQFFRLKQ